MDYIGKKTKKDKNEKEVEEDPNKKPKLQEEPKKEEKNVTSLRRI